MSDILDSLFYGDINPADKALTNDPEYSQALETILEIETKLNELLDDEARSLLHRLIEAEAKIQSIVSRECFIDGFKKGVRIVISAIDDRSNL